MDKLMQAMYDMKAEMGALCRALQKAGICIDAPHQKKTKEQQLNGNQKSKFVGIAKKVNRSKNIASRSVVPDKVPHQLSDTDFEDKPHESSNVAVAMKRKVSINPRALSAALHGMTRSDHVPARAMADISEQGRSKFV
jgi:hypothetical protein